MRVVVDDDERMPMATASPGSLADDQVRRGVAAAQADQRPRPPARPDRPAPGFMATSARTSERRMINVWAQPAVGQAVEAPPVSAPR
jgi:hypothetical protein